MEFTSSVENISDIARKISVQIPRGVFKAQVDQQLVQVSKNAQLKGFRQGKAPIKVVEQLYGPSVRGDVLDKLIEQAYHEVLRKHDLQVVGTPTVNIDGVEGEGDLALTLDVQIYPEPKVKDCFGLKFGIDILKFKEEDIDHELLHLREELATFEEVTDRKKTAKGDVVVFDYEVTADDDEIAVERKAFTNSKLVLEEGAGNEEIIKGLIGAQIDKLTEISIPYPDPRFLPGVGEDELKDIKKGNVIYKMTVRKIEKKVLPELTDELVKEKKLGEDLKGLRETLRKKMETEIERINQNEKENKLFETLIEKNKFEIPEILADQEIREMLFEGGMLDPKDKRSYQIDVSRFRERLLDQAEKRVKSQILLTQVVKQEKVEKNDADLETWLDEQAKESVTDRVQIEKMYGYPKDKNRLKVFLARQEVLTKMLESAVVKETEKAIERNCNHGHDHGDSKKEPSKKSAKKEKK
jgi:trigger factor